MRRGWWIGAATVAALLAAGPLYVHERLRSTETRPRNLAAPPGGYWIHSHDTRVHFIEWGPRGGKPLLLVHGAFAWGASWASQAEALAGAGYRVIAMDLPPFGFSEPPADADYSRAAQAQRIQAVIGRLGPRPVTVVAHSLGAPPAVEAAIGAAQRVDQLVLVDPAWAPGAQGLGSCDAPAPLRKALDSPAVGRLLVGATVTEPHLTQHWLRQAVANPQAVTPGRIAQLQQPFVNEGFSESVAQWARQTLAECARAEAEPARRLRELQVPVTLIWGEQDRVTPPAQAQAWRSALPRARLVTLPGLGHIPQMEDAARFNAALLEVLRSPP